MQTIADDDPRRAYLETVPGYVDKRNAFNASQQAYADKYLVYKPAQLPCLPEYNALPFEIANAVQEFLDNIGLFDDDEAAAAVDELEGDGLHPGEEQDRSRHEYSADHLISKHDLAILVAAIAPAKRRKLGYPDSALSPPDKHRILDTLAKILLQQPLTIPLAKVCKPILLDLASRWLLLLGYDSHTYRRDAVANPASKEIYFNALVAIVRLMPCFPNLYP